MSDPFQGYASLTSQAERWAVVAFSDAVELDPKPKALRCQAAGDIALEGDDGVVAIFTVAAGEVLEVRPVKVKATGTTVAAGSVIAYN